ncbi:DEAD/DEAH box helicase [Methanocaldococcus indicus]|uniref:DEAD/DEAH box helicase n=1 Tax=Methanocaldococcus indicus TaxID=213231 RepID=UPI003C6D6BF6
MYILDSFLSNPERRYLLIFPTRALINNQFFKFKSLSNKLFELTNKKLKIEILHGDISREKKENIVFEKPHVIFTTPDTLHFRILRYNDKYSWLLKNLDLVVVDELHSYRGYLGTNFHYILKRLKYVCKLKYDNNFKYLALSATLRNPTKFCKDMFEEDFILIDKDSSPSYNKYLVLFQPKNYDSKQLIKGIIEKLVNKNIKTICFFDSRITAEKISKMFRNSKFRELITVYKGTLTKNIRNEIENHFNDSKYLCLLSTNALELGIDIGDVSSVVNYGIPADGIFSLIQRFGRAGRKGDALNCIVFKKDALDLYYLKNSKELYEKIKNNIIEHIPINKENEIIAKRHIHNLIYELKRVNIDKIKLSSFEKKIIIELQKENKIKFDIENKELYSSVEPKYYNIRTIGEETYYLILNREDIKNKIKSFDNIKALNQYINNLKKEKIIIEQLSKDDYYRYLLPGYPYYSRGKIYIISDYFEYNNIKFVFVEEFDGDVDYQSKYTKDVKIIQKKDEKEINNLKICFGKLLIEEIYEGFVVRGRDTNKYYEYLNKLKNKGFLKAKIEKGNPYFIVVANLTNYNVESFKEELFKLKIRDIDINDNNVYISIYEIYTLDKLLSFLEEYKIPFKLFETFDIYIIYENPYIKKFETEGIWLVFPEEIKEVCNYEYNYFMERIPEKYKDIAKELYDKIDRKELFLRYRGYTSHYILETIKKRLSFIKDEKKIENISYYIKKLIDSKDIGNGLHAVEHIFIKLIPTECFVDSREIGGYSYSQYEYLNKPTIFVYDGNEGGIGVIERVFQTSEKLLEKSYNHLKLCRCKDGCPLCIYSTKCGNLNEFLDKFQAIKILEKFIKMKESIK